MNESILRQLRLSGERQLPPLTAQDGGDGLGMLAAPAGGGGNAHPELSSRDSLVLMLHVGAEIEHALMVQYLFTGYSIQEDIEIPGQPAGITTTTWRKLILRTAREEMGHFLTIQNALTLLGGALHFDRDNFPHRLYFYPFEFELERLTINSLSRYIAAEMPEDSLIPENVLSNVQLNRIRAITGGTVNRVGLLFAAISAAIPQLNSHVDLRPSDQPWQADGRDWRGNFIRPGDLPTSPIPARGVLASQVLTKADLTKVLGFVAAQGESPDQMFLDSHFARFAKIYREWDEALGVDPAFDPVHPVLSNPNTTIPPNPADVLTPDEQAREQRLAASRIIEPTTSLWAHLFNVRYRLALTAFHHSMVLGPAAKIGPTPPYALLRETLIQWAFEEMTDGDGSLRHLSQVLNYLPSGIAGHTAGPTFELPYTLQLPVRGPARWRLYREMFQLSDTLINDIKKGNPTPDELRYLDGILNRDGAAPPHDRRNFLDDVEELDV